MLFRSHIADEFERISIDEMNHYNKVGAAIIALGGDPKLISFPQTNNKGVWWNGQMVPYDKDVRQMLITTIRGYILQTSRKGEW